MACAPLPPPRSQELLTKNDALVREQQDVIAQLEQRLAQWEGAANRIDPACWGRWLACSPQPSGAGGRVKVLSPGIQSGRWRIDGSSCWAFDHDPTVAAGVCWLIRVAV